MKKLFIFLFFAACFLNAQQSELVNNVWYLEKVSDEIHPGDVYPPVNEEMPQITFSFHQQDGQWYFLTGACAPISGKIGEFGTDSFSYSDLECCDEGEMCTLPENQDFEQLYISYFNQVPDPVLFYFITENQDGTLSLALHTQIFQVMNFKNTSMSVSDADNSDRSDYVLSFSGNELIIRNRNHTSVPVSVEIFELSGKKVFENSSLNSHRIRVGNLSKSVYVLKIRDSEGRIFSKRLRKD